MDEVDSSGFTFDTGLTARVSDMITLGAAGYNLWGKESENFPRGVGGGAVVHPMRQMTLSFDGLWDLDGEDSAGRYGGGAEYFVSTRRGQLGVPLRAGGVYDTVGGGATYATFGLGLSTMKMAFDIGAQRQVRGGDELLVTASLRFYGPRIEAGALN